MFHKPAVNDDHFNISEHREAMAKEVGLQVFQIWREGYSCTGDNSKASLIATIEAANFDEACLQYCPRIDEPPFIYDAESKTWSFWGCRLFDNETDARAAFG